MWPVLRVLGWAGCAAWLYEITDELVVVLVTFWLLIAYGVRGRQSDT